MRDADHGISSERRITTKDVGTWKLENVDGVKGTQRSPLLHPVKSNAIFGGTVGQDGFIMASSCGHLPGLVSHHRRGRGPVSSTRIYDVNFPRWCRSFRRSCIPVPDRQGSGSR